MPELTLQPFETRQLEIGPVQKQLGIPDDAHWALVTLTSPASPDDLMAIAASYDSTGRYGAQTPFSDNLGAYWSGGQWQVDATHNAIIAVTNGGNRATDALLTLHFNDGKKNYEIQQTIQPGEQMWLNLADVIHHSAPDHKGNSLSPDVTSGTYDLEDLNPGLGGNLIEGKVVLDKTWGHLTYGCLTCCGYSPYLSPNPVNVIVSGTGGISTLGTNNCTGVNGYSLNSYFNSTGRWWSDNTGIATVTAYQAKGVSPGTANGYASATILNGDGGRPKSPCPQALQEASAPVTAMQFSVAYSAYIPVDHVSAPATSFCTYHSSPYTYTYMGDANRGTYRVTESVVALPDVQQYSGFFPNTGQTRQYGAYSPKNGSTLSSLDEDGISNDCYLWNNAQTASPSAFQYDVTFPYSHQAQVHYDGSSSNPLESQLAAIQWDMRTTIDTTNPSAPTAIVNYNHTCYPSHQVKVNGQVVYLYTPPENDSVYIFGCLTGLTGKIIGQQTTATQVPPY